MSHFLLLFIDGIGIGARHDSNPFFLLDLPGFQILTGGNRLVTGQSDVYSDVHVFKPIDACLNVSGLPQSGTGQASLFTGINCAELAGRHYGPFPHSTSLPVIADKNVFSRVIRANRSCLFANAYPPIFFEHARKRNRWSVTTRSCLDAEIRIRDMDDLAKGDALAADISGLRLVEHLGLDVQVLDEAQAAQNLIGLSARHAFTAFEYFHTDKAGHTQSHEDAEQCLRSLDYFITKLVEDCLQAGVTLVMTSDHGNIEDLSVKTHTRNPVPFAAYGPDAAIFKSVNAITDLVPAIMSTLSG